MSMPSNAGYPVPRDGAGYQDLSMQDVSSDRPRKRTQASACAQTRLLMWKNCLQKRRNCISTLSELLLPVIGMLILLAIRAAVEVEPISQSYNLDAAEPVVPDLSVIMTDPKGEFASVANLLLMYNTIACGESIQGKKAGPPTTFAISGAEDLAPHKAGIAQALRDFLQTPEYQFLVARNGIKGTWMYNCTDLSILCLLPQNKDTPQCQENKEREVTVNLTEIIGRKNFIRTDFTSKKQLEDYIQSTKYGTNSANSPFHFAVALNRAPKPGSNGSWDYTILANLSAVPSTRRMVNNLIVGFSNSSYTKYLKEGYMIMQYVTDSYILGGFDKAGLKNTQFVPFPVPSYTSDKFASYLQGVLGLFLLIFYMWPFSRLVRNIVEEKEQRIKEGMKIMGLQNSAFWLSWIMTYVIMFTTITILMTIFSRHVFKYSNLVLIFLILWLFSFSLIALACLVSSLFSKAKTAGLLSVFVLFAFYLPYFAVQSEDTALQTRLGTSLLSPVSFSLVMSELLTYESAFVGVQWSNWREGSSGYSVSIAIAMLALDTILYTAMAWYLDKVVPGEYGTARRWNFLCSPSYWCGTRASDNADLDEGLLDDHVGQQEGVQAVSSALQDKQAVRMRKLRKEFKAENGMHVAVNDLDLDMYEGQILVLLGHNGAGKTTTINMLTGMLPCSGGTANIYGKDIRSDMQEIRGSLGFCPQHNILFPSLTVKEHLVFYGLLKGVSKHMIDNVVNKAITEISLEAATNQQAASLSGGQKRRLSLAISLIGGSRVVFLDEPTSGVDPFSRRAIWDLLSKKKRDRVIILTTHFMDEADQLGDRIAIMHHGKLRCCGTSLYLKNIFGVGYNIVMSRREDADRESLNALISRHVPQAELLSDVGTELAYRLPISATNRFPDMLVELETDGGKLGIENFGLSVTTMEEVFLRVANEMNDRKSTEEDVNLPDTLKTLTSSGSSRVHKHKSQSLRRQKSDHAEKLEASEEHSNFGRHMRAMLQKRFLIAKRDRKQQCCQFLTPTLVLLFGMGLLYLPPIPNLPSLELKTSDLNQPLYVPVNSEFKGEPTNGTVLLSSQDGCSFKELKGNFQSLENFSQKLLDTRQDHETSRYGAFFITNQSLKDQGQMAKYNIYTNVTGTHAIPTFWNVLVTGLYREQTNDPKATISVTTEIFPWTDRQTKAFNQLKGLFTSIIISLGMAFIPSSYVAFTVKERASKAKHLQFISGVGMVAYWLSNLVFDFVVFLLPAVSAIVIILGFKQEAFTGANLPVIIVNMLLYGLAVIPFSYLFSFLFTSHTTAQGVMILVYIASGVVLLITSFVFYSIEETKDYADTIRMFFRLFPNFCLGDTIFYLSIVELLGQYTFGDLPGRWDLKISGYDSVFLASEAVVYFTLVLLIEYYSTFMNGKLCHKRVSADLLTKGHGREEDTDVEAEKERIISGEAQGELITLRGVRKVFPQKVAVNELYFSVPQNQCFGFLGVNGAGKSTTLKILTGDEIATDGDALLGGLNILSDPIAVRKMMGYCPQFDALHDLLTAEEHLQLYGRIRGVPEHKLQEMIDFLSERLTLTQDDQHLRPSKTYSGGNKRKLSVGIALIGNPSTVFLDEPSTGMDPVSRRFMWDFISETMANRAVILTTHSMEECEALCSRIGILVHGRLRCIGSGQHLKNRFGTGFEFLLTVGENGKVEDVRQFIAETFKGAAEVESYGGNMKYRLGKQEMNLSKIFRVLEDNKQKLSITEYSIGQTTLEQIFINFAARGDQELEQDEEAKWVANDSKGMSIHLSASHSTSSSINAA